MMRRNIAAAIGAAALIAMPAWAYKLVTHGARVTVARSSLSVQPTIDWNRMQARPGRNAEAWTLDGVALNEVTFYAEIEQGRALFREVDRKNRPLPHFQATMLPTDIVRLFETSYRVAGGSALFSIDSVEPAIFADQRGVRFAYTFTLQNEEVKRRGEAIGAIVGGRLYLITYEAPALYYFTHNLADYRALVASAKLPLPSVRVE